MEEELNDKIKSLIEEKKYEEIPMLLNFYSEKFWAEEYPKKSFDEKVDYWSSSIHRQMRWNGESGFDEMAVFSKADYESWKIKEPEIDKLLPIIIEKLNLNAEKVYNGLKT